ncbi:hypothetical protein [Clostridium sp.]|uniref:hypothetical protein n=1 Tax=Clostridium sp. TaxID=1506 RepID=UPI002FC75337
MLKLERKQCWLVGLTVAIASFIMFFIGVKVVLGNEITFKNITAYIIFSSLVGIVASILTFFTLKIASITFILGLIIGFFQMYISFLKDMSGWGDLVGVMSLVVWIIIGLAAGLLIQLGIYLYKKIKK